MDIKEFKKAIFATVICNSLVWYDYALYATLIGVIGSLFFPSGNETGMLAAFGVFAIGFVTRPLGSLLFGHVGDRHGRRLALIISVISMSVPVFLIAVLPTYKTVGIYATIALILTRMIQGFSLGGEVGNAVFLIEHSPKRLHGFFGSFEVLSAVIGAIFAILVVSLFKAVLSTEQFYEWGWRLPFAIGAFIGIFGTILRFRVEETPEYEQEKKLHSLPALNLFKNYKKKLLVAIGIDSIEQVSLYVFLAFIGSYVITSSGGISREFFEFIHLVFLFILAVLTLLFAYLSDLFGRRKILIFSGVAMFCFAYPIFYLLNGEYGVFGITVSHALLVIVIGAALGPVSAATVEIFPTNVTYTGLAFARNTASAIFGGLTPFACLLLIELTGNKNTPALYLMFCAILGVTASLFLKKNQS